MHDKHTVGSVKEVEKPAGQALQLVLVPVVDSEYPEGHAQTEPTDTAPITPHGRHSYEVVSKKALPHVALDTNPYFVCPVTVPDKHTRQMQTASTARMDDDIRP